MMRRAKTTQLNQPTGQAAGSNPIAIPRPYGQGISKTARRRRRRRELAAAAATDANMTMTISTRSNHGVTHVNMTTVISIPSNHGITDVEMTTVISTGSDHSITDVKMTTVISTRPNPSASRVTTLESANAEVGEVKEEEISEDEDLYIDAADPGSLECWEKELNPEEKELLEEFLASSEWDAKAFGEYLSAAEEEKERAAERRRDEERERRFERQVAQAETTLRAALDAGQRVPIGPFDCEDGCFFLYSSEYLDHYYLRSAPSKRLYFDREYDDEFAPDGATCRPDQRTVSAYVNPDVYFDSMPIDIPKYASLEPVSLYSLPDGKYEMKIVFLGNGCLKFYLPLSALQKGTEREGSHRRREEKLIEFSAVWMSLEDFRRGQFRTS